MLSCPIHMKTATYSSLFLELFFFFLTAFCSLIRRWLDLRESFIFRQCRALTCGKPSMPARIPVRSSNQRWCPVTSLLRLYVSIWKKGIWLVFSHNTLCKSISTYKCILRFRVSQFKYQNQSLNILHTYL